MHFFKGEDDKVGSKDKAVGTSDGRKVDALRLFIANLDRWTTQQDLKEYFSRYGSITGLNLIRERESGMPRGIAFVKMATPQEVKAILKACPHYLRGRSIVVRPAYSRDSRRKVANSSNAKTNHQLVVHDLPPQLSKENILELFGGFGSITNIRIDQTIGKAFVNFSTAVALQLAIAATPPRLKGVSLHVSLPRAHEWSAFNVLVPVVYESAQDKHRIDSEPKCKYMYSSNHNV
ncbi:DAZ-associated protein [Echinococcus granulosus]|uniref:DAZ-associated protein n=1 Tax=Echinococcus granulosus TaxID=6210 RepID=W6UFZ7_ECHGR|nr:DAZ-associated protein [Echinococcus granulosus]EUB57017.1 DAZ-associated protein [Echinococcus granulosus]